MNKLSLFVELDIDSFMFELQYKNAVEKFSK